jgi:hypothetical protein
MNHPAPNLDFLGHGRCVSRNKGWDPKHILRGASAVVPLCRWSKLTGGGDHHDFFHPSGFKIKMAPPEKEPIRLARVASAARKMMMGHPPIIPNMAFGDLDGPRWPSLFSVLGQLG